MVFSKKCSCSLNLVLLCFLEQKKKKKREPNVFSLFFLFFLFFENRNQFSKPGFLFSLFVLAQKRGTKRVLPIFLVLVPFFISLFSVYALGRPESMPCYLFAAFFLLLPSMAVT